MKQLIFYFSILLTLLTTSCSNEDITLSAENNDGKSKITFAVSIPQFAVSSRAFNANNDVSNVTKLDVLVFDDNGIYIAKPTVTLKKTDGKSTGYYSMSLETTTDIRHLHFIANYTDDIAAPTNDVINENMLLSSLKVNKVNDGTDAYWQRITLNGVSEPVDEDKDNLTDGIPIIRLIRNFAAIQLVETNDLDTNNTGENTAFIQGYALYHAPLQGSVAPILRNDVLGGFAKYTTEISYDALVAQGYIGFEPSGVDLDQNSPTTFDTNEKYTYERSQGVNGSHTANPTCIIMKGMYNNKPYYYKIDIAEDYKNFHLLRNFRYIITINKACAGYDTLDDAIKGSSFNQLVDVGIKIEEITDGETTLTVSPTDITLINGVDQKLEVDFKCTSTKTSTPTVKLQGPYDAKPTTNFITGITSGSNEWTISTNENGENILNVNEGTLIVAIDELTSDEIGDRQVQTFEIATSDGLSRKVQITLIDKFRFDPTFTGPNDDELYEYTFHIPTYLPESMFPLEIYLTEPTCSFTPASGKNLSVDWIEPTSTSQGTWRYKKVLTWNEYSLNSTGIYTCYFKANEEITETKTMTVSNTYAYDGSATLQVPTIITIEGSDIVDNTITWYEGEETAKSINVSVTPADVTITLISITGDFTFDEETMTITPNSETPTEGTLTVTASDGTNKTLDLKVLSRPLDMNVEFGNGTQYYGIGKTFTLTFTTNKTGKYKVTNANFKLNSAESPFEFDATANTPIEVETCETITWSDVASITIEYLGDDAGGTNPKTWTGSKRNILLIKTNNSNYNGNTTFKLHTSEINRNNWDSNRNGPITAKESNTLENGIEFEYNNLESNVTYYLAYRTGMINRTYYNESMSAADFATENVKITFEQ